MDNYYLAQNGDVEPNYIPERPQGAQGGASLFISPGSVYDAIRRCRSRWIFIWENGRRRGYWMRVNYLDRQTVGGRVRIGGYVQQYYVDLRNIEAISCYERQFQPPRPPRPGRPQRPNFPWWWML